MKFEQLELVNNQIRLLRGALVCVGKKDKREYLNGLHINGLHITGTDGHRLARFEHGQDMDGLNVIVPAFKVPANADRVLFDFGENETTVTISGGGSFPAAMIMTNINGTYPDVDRIIPTVKEARKAHQINMDMALIADVQKAVKATGCIIKQPDKETNGYLISLSGVPDLTFVAMGLRAR